MRYLIGFGLLLVAVGLPLGASAQGGAEDSLWEDSLSSWQLEAKPVPEEPGPELELDPELAEMELRVKRARIGLISTAVAFPLGLGLLVGAVAQTPICVGEPCPDPPKSADGLVISGAILMAGAAAGMIATGILLGARKRKLRDAQAGRRETVPPAGADSLGPAISSDDEGRYSVDYAPATPTREGELRLAERRVRRNRITLLSAAGATVLGITLAAVSGVPDSDRLADAGALIAISGAAGMIASGIALGVRNGQLQRLQRSHRPGRVQWDVAQSRLVF